MIPIRTQILVKPFPADDISEGGIIIPDSAKKTSDKVLVVKCGNGTKEKPMKLREGDTGYRVHGWGTEIMINDELHILLDQDAILAVQ